MPSMENMKESTAQRCQRQIAAFSRAACAISADFSCAVQKSALPVLSMAYDDGVYDVALQLEY